MKNLFSNNSNLLPTNSDLKTNYKYQSLNGDISYLGLFEISDENRELYKKVIGITGQEGVTEEDDTPKALNFNEIDMLIPYLIKVKLNNEL